MKKIIIFIFLSMIVYSYSQEIDTTDDKGDIELTNNSIENKIINKIILKGNKKAKKKEIDTLMIIKEGMNLNLSLVEQDYLKLMELNYFEDIIISTSDVFDENGVVVSDKIDLVLEFQEKPTISRILFKGNKSIGVGFLLGDITVKNGDIIDKGAIVTDLLAIEKKYKEKGFNYAKVDYEIYQNEILNEKKQVHLIFNINEGPETFVSEIEILGNDRFTDSTLKTKMKTKERKYFGIQKGAFQENLFYEDIDMILAFYRDQGYIKADIEKPEISRFTIEENNIKKESIKITLILTEGKQYIYGGIELSGNKIFTEEDLTYSLKLRKDQTFNFTKFQIDLYALNLKYRNAGYIETRITEIPYFDEESNTISYKINIIESKRSYIESVFFRGNEKTRTYVLERSVFTKVGDILEQSNLEASRIGLMNLGFFGNVTYEIQQGSKQGLLRVIYILEERLTADFKFGLQVTTSQIPPDVTLFGEISEKNFLGRELSMSGKLALSIFKQGVDFKLDDPWFLNSPINLGGTVKVYHNWTQKVLKKITPNDYIEYSGSNVTPTEDDIRNSYDESAGSNVHFNENYIGAEGDGSWGNMGLHDINFEIGARAGYRFLNYFSVSANYSLSPIYTFLPTVSSLSTEEYAMKVNEIDSESYKALLLNNEGWSVKSRIGTTFSISTTKRRINPYDGFRFSLTTAYTWGHFDSISISSYFTYYLKLMEIDFNNWVFNNVVVFNAGASFLFPGLRNLGGQLNGKDTAGKGPILYPSDSLYVDGFFIGRGWGASIGTTSGYEGKLTNKTGYARFDGSIEYRIPIHEQFIWIAAFIDIVNLIEGPKRNYMLTDEKTGNTITVDGEVLYGYDSSNSWMWWEQKQSNSFYNDTMTDWYGLENWYGSVGLGVQLTIPQLPLSFYVVKRFQVNYNGGFEWVGNTPNSPNLDFVLSMVGIYF